jgi:hypothetical protein
MGTSVGRQTTTALIPKAVTAAYLRASPDPLCTMPSTSTHRNTLINSTTVTCFKYRKNSHFASSCPELKDIVNIKEIEEEEMSNKSKKKNFRKDSPLRYSIDLNKINLSQLIDGKHFTVPYIVF